MMFNVFGVCGACTTMIQCPVCAELRFAKGFEI